MVVPAPEAPDGAGDAAAEEPALADGAGEPDETAAPDTPPPRASMAAGEPGAMFDSAASKRSTAKCAGALGSAGGAVGTAVAETLPEVPGAAPGEAVGPAVGPAVPVGRGAGDGVAFGKVAVAV